MQGLVVHVKNLVFILMTIDNAGDLMWFMFDEVICGGINWKGAWMSVGRSWVAAALIQEEKMACTDGAYWKTASEGGSKMI